MTLSSIYLQASKIINTNEMRALQMSHVTSTDELDGNWWSDSLVVHIVAYTDEMIVLWWWNKSPV